MEKINIPNDRVTLKGSNVRRLFSLGVLFVSFLGFLFLALPTIVTGETPSEDSGREAYRPADFPTIFGKDPVVGLASISSLKFFGSTTASLDPSHSINVAKPPLSEGIFPCSNCHEGMETDETVRTVGPPHDDIVLHHGEKGERWCLDCHNAKDRNVLRLINGTTIPFEESPRLCGQCHGTTYNDWKIGIHGKRVGFWNGPKIYLLCVHCHDQHSPRFRLLTPLPPPVKPEFQRFGHTPSSTAVGSDTREYKE